MFPKILGIFVWSLPLIAIIGWWKLYKTPEKLKTYQWFLLILTVPFVYITLGFGIIFSLWFIVMAPLLSPILAYLSVRTSMGLMFLAAKPNAPWWRIDLLCFAIFALLFTQHTHIGLMITFFLLGITAEGILIFYYKRKYMPQKPKAENIAATNIPNTPKPTIPIQDKTTQKVTPLLQAVIDGNENAVRQALAEDEKQLNVQFASNGNTPLHIAVWNGHKHIVELLLLYPGIDLYIKNKDGKTAFDLAQDKNLPEIINLLASAGNKQDER